MATVATKKKGPARPAADAPERKNRISLRGSEEWWDWVREYAAFRRIPVASLIDQVLNEGAKRDGFRAPPDR